MDCSSLIMESHFNPHNWDNDKGIPSAPKIKATFSSGKMEPISNQWCSFLSNLAWVWPCKTFRQKCSNPNLFYENSDSFIFIYLFFTNLEWYHSHMHIFLSLLFKTWLEALWLRTLPLPIDVQARHFSGGWTSTLALTNRLTWPSQNLCYFPTRCACIF